MANLVDVGTTPGDGTGDLLRDAFIKTNSNTPDNVIVIKQASDFGTIDSTKQYFLAANIDMGTTSIDLSGGKDISIRGADFNVSGLFSTEDNYTLFSGADAGNVNMFDIGIDVSGANSKVYDLTGNTGFEAIELTRVNYNNCTSLGSLNTYRQGLEVGTGRFGGKPSLELIGNWVGGFRITTSIVRNIDDTMADALFKAGTGLVMNSRFLTDINADLGTLAPLIDFAESNFTMFNSLQLIDCIITRNGVVDSEDTTIYPNINSGSSYSKFKNNVGLPNTYEGGVLELTTEAETTINTVDVFETLLGVYTASDLQHFDSPVNGQLRNISGSPVDFKIITYIVLQGGANDIITIRLRKFDFSTSTTSTIITQQATVNNFQGGTDRCTFSILGRTKLEENDYYFIEVANNSDTTNVTSLIGSFTTIEER
jgi:hypothetical protein